MSHEIFTSYEELRRAIGANNRAVVVECEGGGSYKIYGTPLNPQRDINPDGSNVRQQLARWQVQARFFNVGGRVEIVKGTA